MKMIKQILEEFLKEQEARLRPKTYGGYEDAIYLFEQCLNGYAYQYLNKKDGERFDRLYNQENQEFCEVFGPDKIGPMQIGEFLDYFMIRKVMGSKEHMKTVGRVMRKLVKWMGEKGYMREGELDDTTELVDELKDDLPKVRELSNLIYEYIQSHMVEAFSEIRDSHFRVTRIESGKLWLEDTMGGDEVGPVIVSPEISSLCKEGWTIDLELGKGEKCWNMLESGKVYPV